jgi:hypothetical protein
MKLSAKNQKWLKVLHVYLGGIWGGGAASLFAIHCLYPTNSGAEFYARNMAMIFIDNYIIIPAAIGSCLTGLIYSHLTKWGYVKYYWVMTKWILTIMFIVIGFFWLIPWLNNMLEISEAIRYTPVIDSSNYDVAMSVHFAMTVLQVVLLFFVVIISVFKPWGRTYFKRESFKEVALLGDTLNKV